MTHPFSRKLVSDLSILSPFDEQDWVLEPPSGVQIPKKFGGKQNLPILQQNSSDYCTAFSLFRYVADMLYGAGDISFKNVFNNKNAYEIARSQMRTMSDPWWQSLLRGSIHIHNGRNLRAALWYLSKGHTFANGSVLKIGGGERPPTSSRTGIISYSEKLPKGYYKIRDITNESLRKVIAHYGGCYVGVILKKNHFHPITGELVNSGDLLGGHAMYLSGYDERGFYAPNSWGPMFGDKGYCFIPDSKVRFIQECWVVKGVDFYSPSRK